MLAAVISATFGSIAQAQSFTWAPVSGTQQVPFVLNTGNALNAPTPLSPTWSEFTTDPFSNNTPALGCPMVPATTTQRIAADLRRRYRVIGNPFLRSAQVRFSWFDMNGAVPFGGGDTDRVELGWASSPPATLTGCSSSAVISVAATGTNSLMSPTAAFSVFTGPHHMSTASAISADNESLGFVTSRIDVTGNGVQQSSVWSTLAVYESVIGVAMATDDVVDAKVAHTGYPMSVAMWLPQNNLTSGLILWARCGAPPTATAWLRRVPTNSSGGAFFQIDPAECVGQLHISVTNTSAQNRAFRLAIMSTRNTIDDMHIGVGWNATASQMADIRQSFRQAAWQLFGLSAGNVLIRSYEFFHDANACDDGWPAENSACYGEGCAVCLSPSFGTSNYNGTGKVTLYAGPPNTAGTPANQIANNWGATAWMQGGNVIVHEFGHMLLGLTNSPGAAGDEYISVNGTDRDACGHTWMGLWVDNQFTFCTPAEHRGVGYDFNLTRSHRGPVSVIGTTSFQIGDPRSDWQDMWDDGHLTAPFPVFTTQEVIRMRHFFASSVMGRCDFGC